MSNIFMSGMAEFLDFDMESDEDFEESVQQGKVQHFFKKHSCLKYVRILCGGYYNLASNFHFGPEKYNTIAKISFVVVKW